MRTKWGVLFGMAWGFVFSEAVMFFTNGSFVALTVLTALAIALLWGMKILLEMNFIFKAKHSKQV
jgi:hypothetical protein